MQKYISHSHIVAYISGLTDDRKLFVGMIAKTTTEADLQSLFGAYGNIESINILIGPDGQSKGCAFVKYSTASEANQAIIALNNTTTIPGVILFLCIYHIVRNNE